MTDYYVGQGVVCGGKSAKYGRFLGVLASIGVPLAIEAIKGLFGKGMHVNTPRPPHHHPPPSLGAHLAEACTSTPAGLNSSPLHPSMEAGAKKVMKFKDVPYSNFDPKKIVQIASTLVTKQNR